MSVKKTRLDVLRVLIRDNAYNSQEALLKGLKEQGFDIAQPTLSRDLRQLRVAKVYDKNGDYSYVLPPEGTFNFVSPLKLKKERVTQSFGFLSVDYSGNLAVVKTLHGYANSLAAEIDDYEEPAILGSLAGDDTVVLVLKEGTRKSVIQKLLKQIIPEFGK